MTKVIKRTPDLGLTLRLQPLVVEPTQALCTPCDPAIGGVGWWDSEASAYCAETVVGLLIDERPSGPWGWEARVTGELCACVVDWSTEWTPVVEGAAAPRITVAGASFCVSADLEADAAVPAAIGSGALTVNATVVCGEARTTLDPIYLVVTDSATSGGVSPTQCPSERGEVRLFLWRYELGYWELAPANANGVVPLTVGDLQVAQIYFAPRVGVLVDGAWLTTLDLSDVTFSPNGYAWVIKRRELVVETGPGESNAAVAEVSALGLGGVVVSGDLTIEATFEMDGARFYTSPMTIAVE